MLELSSSTESTILENIEIQNFHFRYVYRLQRVSIFFFWFSEFLRWSGKVFFEILFEEHFPRLICNLSTPRNWLDMMKFEKWSDLIFFQSTPKSLCQIWKVTRPYVRTYVCNIFFDERVLAIKYQKKLFFSFFTTYYVKAGKRKKKTNEYQRKIHIRQTWTGAKDQKITYIDTIQCEIHN